MQESGPHVRRDTRRTDASSVVRELPKLDSYVGIHRGGKLTSESLDWGNFSALGRVAAHDLRRTGVLVR